MTGASIRGIGNHELDDARALMGRKIIGHDKYLKFTYEFENFFHPFVGQLIKQLNRESVDGLLDSKYHKQLEALYGQFFGTYYKTPQNSPEFRQAHPNSEKEVEVLAPTKKIELEGGPYSNYNWELLFHFPLTIAVHLSKNQRFAEAQRWFHYIFDPTCNDTSIPVPERFWKFLAFRKPQNATRIDELLALLSKPNPTNTEKNVIKDTLEGYERIKNSPFRPHTVARSRPLAYQYCVVMKYLDNLIAWGDHLFRQDTIESINEATQRYVLAANLLGARPQRIPSRGYTRPKNFKQLKEAKLDAMGNALVDLEGQFPFNFSLPQAPKPGAAESGPLFGIGRTLYFCVPRNEKMLSYWDTVADRLFKIRNCMNIEGVVRQLALFDPPIDPGLLVKAAAAGIDIGSIVSGLNQPIGPARGLLLLQKAQELCAELRGLGSALLSAIEKGDAERLALLRQGHEVKIQEMSQEVRFLQWKQAQEASEALLRSRASALERYRYYQLLLGAAAVAQTVPETLTLDRRKLTEESFDEAYAALVGQYEKAIPTPPYPKLKLAGGSSPRAQSGASGNGALYLIENEAVELNEHLPAARDWRLYASASDTLASVLVFFPDLDVNLQFWGLGGTSKVFTGIKISEASKLAADIMRTKASWESDQGGIASRTASYERRADEWALQASLAARELAQMGRQLIGSLIAEQVAHQEYLNVRRQIEHSQEVDRLLREKFSNEELYAWMQGETARLYYEYYRFAFDTARKAEQSIKRELMRPEVDKTDFVKFNYWDGGRKGLLSGEALYLDLKRLEMAYHENNKREYELTKHVSLRQLAPAALLSLKATGSCEFAIPEWLFDLDNPGHYMRRIKMVGLSVPAVTGPYTAVNCKLTLLRSSLRKSPLGDYAREGAEDGRFVDYSGAIQSIVTSSGNNDNGLFEANIRDERTLPFEGAGAEGTWRLELPGKFRAFDYESISDVVLHVRYTARDGGETLRGSAVDHLKDLAAEFSASKLGILLNLKHEFPSEWARFIGGENFKASVGREHFPFFARGQGMTIDIEKLELYEIGGGAVASKTVAAVNPGDGSFGLDLDGAALTRDPQASPFLLARYSVAVP